LLGLAVFHFPGVFQFTQLSHSIERGAGPTAASLEGTERPLVVDEDGRVRDCITGDVRGTGRRGEIETTEFDVPPASGWSGSGADAMIRSSEDRNASETEFRKIFKNRIWTFDKKHPPSGFSSTIEYAVDAMIGLHAVVEAIKAKLGLKTIRILDMPCGDMTWMRRFLDSHDDVDYTGMDILEEIIETNRKDFANQTLRRFVVGDIIRDGLKEKYDLVLCRHLLHNIFTRDAMLIMAEVSRSGSGYFLLSSYPHASKNTDLKVDDVFRARYMNHEAPPISLAPPLCYFRDGLSSQGRDTRAKLVLYKLPLRRVKDCQSPTKMILAQSSRFKTDYYSCGNWSM